MKILLDTTIQINRLFKPKEREEIKRLIRGNECYCSSFVLGEFMSSVVNDFVTLYGIMQIEDNLTDVYQRIAEVYNSRSKTRMIYLVNDLAREYDGDYDLIKEELELYPERLRKRFYYGIQKELLDMTQCARAKAFVELKDGSMRLKGITCRNTDNQCNADAFWKQNKKYVDRLEENREIPEKMVPVLEALSRDNKIPRGNACRSMGDCIISLESLELEDGKVVSANIKDFLPICRYVGACLIGADGSDVKD